MARGPSVHGCAARVHRIDRGRCRTTRARSPGVERPRPSRSRLRDGRGRRARGAHPGAVRVGRRRARGPDGLARHGRVESLSRHGAVRHRAPRPRAPIRHRPACGHDPKRRRHAAPLLLVRAPRSHAIVGSRVDPSSSRRPHHAPDRAGLPRPRGHDGAAHQPRQAHGQPRRHRRLRRWATRRRAHGDARAVSRVQRGIFRRRRPRGGGDPTRLGS